MEHGKNIRAKKQRVLNYKMLMLCYKYCIPFLHFMLYAMGPMLLLFCAFIFKRSIVQERSGLRRFSLALGMLVLCKIGLFDIVKLAPHMACTYLPDAAGGCQRSVYDAFIYMGYGLSVSAFIAFLWTWQRFGPKFQPKIKEVSDHELRVWANAGMTVTCVFTFLQMIPWISTLLTGEVPRFATLIPWKLLALVCFGLLLIGFWHNEDKHVKIKSYRAAAKRTSEGWRPRDTLWMALILYIIMLALSFVIDDILGA